MRTNRALILSHGNRSFNLEDSLREYDYVITRAPTEFVLLPEMLTRKGENLILLDRPAEAAIALLRAIELKPDYWPPYTVMSDYFKKIKNNSTAREWIQKGLAASPKAEALRRRMTELDAISAK
jgi:tetratricopeptide (TPR) repeat protein